MLADNVSSMSSICKVLIILLLVITLCKSKPVDSILGSGINIIDFLGKLESHPTQKFSDKLLSQISKDKSLLDSASLKWEPNTIKNSDNFRIVFCDTLEELYHAIDGGFKISGLDNSIIRHYQEKVDLPDKYLASGYSYLFVKYSHIKKSASLKNYVLRDQDLLNVESANNNPVFVFFKKYGTHYLSSYSLGNSVYQVYVYPKERLRKIRWKLQRSNSYTLAKLKKLVSPYYFEYVGPMKTLNDDKTFLEWFDTHFYSPFLIDRYLEIRTNKVLLTRFKMELDRRETLVNMDLKSLETVINDPDKKKQIHEFLDNQLKLYQANI